MEQKNIKILLIAFFIMLLLSITATFFITKGIYNIQIPPLPEPKNEIIKNKVDIPPVVMPAKIRKEKIDNEKKEIKEKVPDDLIANDKQEVSNDSVTIAEADSVILFVQKIQDSDSTNIEITDTLKASVKYFYPPLNYFKLSAQLNYSSLRRTEYKPVYIEKKETFFERFAIIIGAGYATHLEKIEPKPSIFIGLGYKL